MKRLIIALAGLIAFAGCATTGGEKEANAVKPPAIKLSILTEEGVPVYPGFKLIPSKSFVYESGTVKVGRLVFTGKAKVKEIVDYYKDTLPGEGWKPVAITMFGKQADLTYVTPDRTLQIQISKGFSETLLIIQVGPRGELTTQGH